MAIDAVIVSYRSAPTLRGCVEPLASIPGVRVTVVDNASPDDAVETITDLDVDIVRSERNGGFSYGCNLGAARGSAPFLLFLNPDARIGPASLESLAGALLADPGAGLAGPRITGGDGELAWSVRHFPSQRSTFALALFAHRLWPLADWTDELVRDPLCYERSGTRDWISGACMLVRRSAFEAVGRFDERFFLYCEDTDLCKRLWDAGHAVRFEATADARHVEGSSSGAGETQAILAASRVRYARKHMSRRAARVQAVGIALGEATHALAAVARPSTRRGHMAALRAVAAGTAGAELAAAPGEPAP